MTNKLKKGLQIYLFFLKIGCFTFGGGWGIIAQMEQEFVDRRKWITSEELLDLIAVGKSIPGIMITNVSMLFGYHIAGWFGGICAVIGITCPAVVILTVVALFYDLLKQNPVFNSALLGIRSAVVPIMISALISLAKDALKTRRSLLIFPAAVLLLQFTPLGNVSLILCGVVLGFLMCRIELPRKEEK